MVDKISPRAVGAPNMLETLSYLLDNIFIRFGTKLYVIVIVC